MYIEIPNLCPCPSTSYVPYISSVKTGRAKYLLGFAKVKINAILLNNGYVLFRSV